MGVITGDGDRNANTDPLTTAAEAAWLDLANGTYSTTDKRIFIAGFMAGQSVSQTVGTKTATVRG